MQFIRVIEENQWRWELFRVEPELPFLEFLLLHVDAIQYSSDFDKDTLFDFVLNRLRQCSLEDKFEPDLNREFCIYCEGLFSDIFDTNAVIEKTQSIERHRTQIYMQHFAVQNNSPSSRHIDTFPTLQEAFDVSNSTLEFRDGMDFPTDEPVGKQFVHTDTFGTIDAFDVFADEPWWGETTEVCNCSEFPVMLVMVARFTDNNVYVGRISENKNLEDMSNENLHELDTSSIMGFCAEYWQSFVTESLPWTDHISLTVACGQCYVPRLAGSNSIDPIHYHELDQSSVEFTSSLLSEVFVEISACDVSIVDWKTLDRVLTSVPLLQDYSGLNFLFPIDFKHLDKLLLALPEDRRSLLPETCSKFLNTAGGVSTETDT